MALPNLSKALDPVEFRFTDPDDAKRYGDRWYVYDEAAVLRLPARDLIALETDLGMSIVSVMNGYRSSSVLGDTAVAWLGVRAVDQRLAGNFDDFNPITMAIEWRKLEPGKGPSVAESPDTPELPAFSSTTDVPSTSTTSVPRDTVALPLWPIAESQA